MINICVKRGVDKMVCYKPNAHGPYIGSFEVWSGKDKDVIWSLSIHSAHRHKGHATQMLTEFLSTFKSDKPLVLYVYKDNAIAIHLYEKVGFVITGDHHDYAYEMQYIPQ